MVTFYEKLLENGDWTLVLPVVLICLATYIYIRWIQRIPGPIGLPYLGYYPFLSDENMHKQLAEMTKKYGDVFCFTVTGQTYAHLGSLKTMREAFVTKGNCFMKKSSNFNLLMNSVEDGVFYTSGEKWKVLRRFFSQKLKEYGMGKGAQEAWVVDALQRTVDVLKNSGGKDFNATEFFIGNCGLATRPLFFRSSDVADDDIKGVVKGFEAILAAASGTGLLLAGSLFKYVMQPFMPSVATFRKGKAQTDALLTRILRQHEQDFDKDNIRDLVDCYIDERRILEEKGDPRAKFYTEKAFVDTVLQIVADAVLTIGALVGTVLKVISDKPEVQKQIQLEVDEVLGRDRFPSWEFKNRMPYTVAVIYEAVRTTDFFPMFPSLACTEETTIGGCRIPKGAILLNNFYSALKDPRVYEEPEVFDPTRFLPTEDKKLKSEIPSIFGMGKRSCLGEMLVNMEAFLFLTTVMQKFDLLPATSSTGEHKTILLTDFSAWIRAVPRKS